MKLDISSDFYSKLIDETKSNGILINVNVSISMDFGDVTNNIKDLDMSLQENKYVMKLETSSVTQSKLINKKIKGTFDLR